VLDDPCNMKVVTRSNKQAPIIVTPTQSRESFSLQGDICFIVYLYYRCLIREEADVSVLDSIIGTDTNLALNLVTLRSYLTISSFSY